MDHNNVRSRAGRSAFWHAAADLWRGSGLGMAEFCRREKLNAKTFCAWRKRDVATKSGRGPDHIPHWTSFPVAVVIRLNLIDAGNMTYGPK